MFSDDIEAREKFLFTLGWLLAVTKRQSANLQFCLAHINFENPDILGETYGAQKASEKLDEVSHLLRKAFRKTDLVAREGGDFWILVPYTPPEEKLVDKIKYIIEIASQSGLQIVERDISIFPLSQHAVEHCEGCAPLDFLSYLKKNHITLASRQISLPEGE